MMVATWPWEKVRTLDKSLRPGQAKIGFGREVISASHFRGASGTSNSRYSRFFVISCRFHAITGCNVASGSTSSSASNSVSLSRTNGLTILLSFDSGGVDILNGQMSDGNWTAELVANRTLYPKTNLAPQAGKYTLLLPSCEPIFKFQDFEGCVGLHPGNGSGFNDG